MRVLHVTDLHFSKPWFEWLLRNAIRYDLVCISGDLFDLCGPEFIHNDGGEVIAQQSEWLTDWMRAYVKETPTPLALCSGNHDDLGWAVAIRFLFPKGKILSDQSSEILDLRGQKLVVSCLPYFGDDEVSQTLLEGDRLRHEHGAKWIVLSHEPPFLVEPVCTIFGEEAHRQLHGVEELLAEHRPDYVLSGHIHELPYGRVGDCWRPFQNTTLLNPGQNDEAAIPNFIEFDPFTHRAAWSFTARGGSQLRIQRDPKNPM